MAPVENYAASPVLGTAIVGGAANPNRDGTGTLVDLVQGATFGTRIDRVGAKAVGTTTAGMLRLFLYNGTTTTLYDEIAVTAIAPSATQVSFKGELPQMTLDLPLGWTLRISSEKAEIFHVTVEGAAY